MKAKPSAPAEPEFPKVIETHSRPWVTGRELHAYIDMAPSTFNGNVRVRRYRVTIEEVPEEPAVLEARLRELWELCDKWHHCGPLRAEARRLGITLDMKDFGGRLKNGATG